MIKILDERSASGGIVPAGGIDQATSVCKTSSFRNVDDLNERRDSSLSAGGGSPLDARHVPACVHA
jgi:hypothetical protein